MRLDLRVTDVVDTLCPPDQDSTQCAHHSAGLYTRAVLDAIIDSSRNGPWAKVEIPLVEETGPNLLPQSAEDKEKSLTHKEGKEQERVITAIH